VSFVLAKYSRLSDSVVFWLKNQKINDFFRYFRNRNRKNADTKGDARPKMEKRKMTRNDAIIEIYVTSHLNPLKKGA